MNQKLRKPHLRIALTSECNFRCIYCKEGGEGIKSKCELGFKDITKILEIAKKVGFSHLKFTGGEPLLYEKKYQTLFEIIKYAKNNLKYEDVQMVTNGYYILDFHKKILSSGLDSLTVSLDSSNANDFKNITGINCFQRVIDGIKIIRDNDLPVVINCVYFDKNSSSINKIIDLALELQINIKILDYVDLNDEAKYVPLNDLYERMDKKFGKYEYILPPGGLGTPMRKYSYNKSSIIIKDAMVGTNYNKDVCNQCIHYPCQDAMISLRITADGKLKRCLVRDDNLIDIKSDLDNGNYGKVKLKLQESYDLLINSKYEKEFWKITDI